MMLDLYKKYWVHRKICAPEKFMCTPFKNLTWLGNKKKERREREKKIRRERESLTFDLHKKKPRLT
jgi:hypothetical protein